MNTYVKGQRIRLSAIFGINATELAASAAAGATTITVRDATGYAAADNLTLAPGTDFEETHAVSSVSGRVITLGTPLAYRHAPDTPVWELSNSTVTLWVENPAGTETEYAPTNDSTGKYHYDLDVPDAATSPGTWHVRWESTVTVIAADEGQFTVRASQFT